MNVSRRQFQDITERGNRVDSLGCPSLELVDPTPDVFALFAQFNQRFFWGRLNSVSVRWSKRMYSCAGICRYRGREGFCEVALSEPLLKLRSRKNLIETLLHEMIHAYLFVTQNNTDRDGHGPNFHLHMNRINKEANINITVFHSFIDEVHLYKTHWWRCEGPCRDRKPFFGTVRRSSNRAPGPNDFWWQQHQNTCGGTFIKIKEPEKKQIKKSEPKKKTDPPKNNTKKDIRKYFMSPNKEKRKSDASEPVPKKFKPDLANSSTPIIDITKINRPSTSKSKKSSSIMNIDLTNIFEPSTSSSNGNNTITNIDMTKELDRPSTSNVIDTVRNHWATKYDSPSSKNKPVNTSTITSPVSDSTLTDYNKIIQDLYGPNVSLGPEDFKPEPDDCSYSKCPLCNISILDKELSDHITDCVEKSVLEDKKDLDDSNSDIVDLTSMPSSDDMVSCPVCNKKIRHASVEAHLEDCLNTTIEDGNKDKSDTKPKLNENSVSLIDSDDEGDRGIVSSNKCYPCPCCLNLIDEALMNDHLDLCVL